MPQTDFLPFATNPGANVVSQPNYAADPSTGAGFSPGIALSAKLNKVWRQSSFVTAALSKLMLENLDIDILDDGDLQGFTDKLRAALIALQPRIVIPNATDFYVNATNGSDSYDGLTATTPWQTLQHAADTIINDYDFNGQRITVHVANGTYQGFSVWAAPQGLSTAFNWVWSGNVSNPQACVINGVGNYGCIAYGGWMLLEGFRITATVAAGTGIGGYGIIVKQTAIALFRNVDFGPCDYGHFCCDGGYGGPYGNYQISGGAPNHWYSANQGRMSCPPSHMGEPPVQVTITGNPTFTNFASASGSSSLAVWPGHMSFLGTCVGSRYAVTTNSVMYVPSGDPNFWPGTTPGYPAAVTPGVAPNLTLPGWNSFGIFAGIFAGTTMAATKNGLLALPQRLFEDPDAENPDAE